MTVKEEPEVFVPSGSAQQQGQAYVPSASVQQAEPQIVVQHPAQPQAAYAQPIGVAPAASMQPQMVQPMPVSLPGLGKDPKRITCPYCHQSTVTSTTHEIDACTIIAVIVLLLLFWPVFWIPFLGSCCKTTNHHCGNCHRKVGSTGAC